MRRFIRQNRWFICVEGSIRLNRSNLSLNTGVRAIVSCMFCAKSGLKLKSFTLQPISVCDHCYSHFIETYGQILSVSCRAVSCHEVHIVENPSDQHGFDCSASKRASPSIRLFIFIAGKNVCSTQTIYIHVCINIIYNVWPEVLRECPTANRSCVHLFV